MAGEIQKTRRSSSSSNNNHHSPSNSQGSSTHPYPPSSSLSPLPSYSFPQKEEVAEEDFTPMDTGGSALPHNNPQLSHTQQCFTDEEILKYDKYEAGYASYLRAKYFSDKDIYGGDIFDLVVPVGSETIKASRWSPTRSYADPAQSFVDFGNVLATGEEIPVASASSPNIANGNVTPVKKTS